MYSINNLNTPESVDLLYLQFLAIRLRIQQLVVLFVHTWKNDNQTSGCDLILELMRKAGKAKKFLPDDTVVRNHEPSKPNKVELSELDILILDEVKKEKGCIKLGSGAVFFNFYFEKQDAQVSYVHEHMSAPSEVCNFNPVFFAACKSAFLEAPPKYPTTNMEKHLHV